jgi:hypothetical protein
MQSAREIYNMGDAFIAEMSRQVRCLMSAEGYELNGTTVYLFSDGQLGVKAGDLPPRSYRFDTGRGMAPSSVRGPGGPLKWDVDLRRG